MVCLPPAIAYYRIFKIIAKLFLFRVFIVVGIGLREVAGEHVIEPERRYSAGRESEYSFR